MQLTILKSGLSLILFILAMVAIAVLLPAAEAPLPDPRQDYVLRNVHVVDVERGLAGDPTSVTVKDGKIAAIGTETNVRGLPVIDGAGGYLIPGLWNMHMHSFQLSPQMHMPLLVANGITSVRDMMDCPGESDTLIACANDKRRWNDEIVAGTLAGPRIASVASYYFEGPDLTPADASRRAREAKARGIDELKVYNRLSPATYNQVAREARATGLRLVGHLPKAVSLEQAIAAGQRSFEHAHLFSRHCFARADDWRQGKLDAVPPHGLLEAMVAQFDEPACTRAFALMRRSGAWYVPTHVTREDDARAFDPAFSGHARLAYLDPLSRWAFKDDLAGARSAFPGKRGERALKLYFDHGVRLTGAAHAAGVPILVGTDTVTDGLRYHDELMHLARAGLSPTDVLRAATINAARFAGLESASGSIRVGKTADLVLLGANPLTDVRNLGNIRAVMIGGRTFDQPRLAELLRFTRAQAQRPANWIKLLWGFARSSVTSVL